MNYWKDYGYVDAHYEHPTRKRRMKWVRLQVEDVSKRIIAKSRSTNCFTTVQRFRDATSLLEMEREAASPKKKNGHDPEEAARLERMKEGDELPDCQMRYHGLFFDFDCDHNREGITIEEALLRSQEDTQKLVRWFHQTFPDLNPAHVQIWFSGRKGFHVTVRPEPFGIKPHGHLTYIVRGIALELADSLDLKTLDRSVYTRRRMWRIPNTINPKSGKFKIELFAGELDKWDIARMLVESKEPRTETNADEPMAWSHLWDKQEYKDIGPDDDAVGWYQHRFSAYDAYKDLKNLHPRKPILTFEEAGEEWPVCVVDLMKNGPKEGGPKRNRVILPLAGFMYDAGMDKREAHKRIGDWTKGHYPQDRWLEDRIANGKSVVESAYRGQVRFSCRFIRSCNGTGDKGRVACVKEENCPWINNPEDQEPAQVPFMHLSEASKGCYNGTKIRTAIHVATIAGRPFQLPMAGSFSCEPDPDAKICKGCTKGKTFEDLKWSFDSEDRAVLNLVNVNDNIKKGTIKASAGIPAKCYRVKMKIEEHGNLEEIQVIPMVDYANAYDMDADEDDVASKGSQHVVRLAYYMGHGIEANKKYIVEPTVLGHPKDQRVCFLFDKLEPAQNDIDQFKMTPELHHKLKEFRPSKDQTVEQKLLEIHRDLTVNVHRIGGRFDLSIGVDLCYHSVIGFKFAGDEVNKGWFELVVIGDTSTGKSTLIQRMMTHFGLGELIAGEQAKRTGLIYASVQVAGQWVLIWGKIPQNDRRLLVIDEFSGIPGEEVSKMTQLRSEGKAQGGGVNAHYETFARTRMILLTNPRGNKGSLQGFNYGVQAVDQLFDERADLRRVDLAMIMEETDVPKETVTKRWDKVDLPHIYTADLCRSLVLWAWSRNPHHIEFSPEAEDEAIEWAGRLGDTYECDLPLAIRTDLKIKIARIAAAVAARLFSTDDEAKKVLIKVEHVQFAAKFIDRCYRKPAMSFFEYARKFKLDNHFTQEKKADIKYTLESFRDERDSIVSALLDVELITKPLFIDMVNIGQDDFKKLWKFMVGQRL